jgi:hypothetical protein
VGKMNWGDILKAVIPVVVAAIAWLLGEVNGMGIRMTKIEGQLPMLITPQGIPTDSPLSAEARHKMREEMFTQINDLSIRLRLMEERLKQSN